jgi:hypothetical protein
MLMLVRARVEDSMPCGGVIARGAFLPPVVTEMRPATALSTLVTLVMLVRRSLRCGVSRCVAMDDTSSLAPLMRSRGYGFCRLRTSSSPRSPRSRAVIVRRFVGHRAAVQSAVFVPSAPSDDWAWVRGCEVGPRGGMAEEGEGAGALKGKTASCPPPPPPPTKIVTGSADRTVKVWCCATGGCLVTLSVHSGAVFRCAVLPPPPALVACSLFSPLVSSSSYRPFVCVGSAAVALRA